MNKKWLYLALLMVPLFGFWIIPQNKALKTETAKIEDLQAETQSLQTKIKKLKDLDTLLSDPKYDGVLERIPATLEQETLILILEKIAKSTGFVFDSISFSRGQNAELESSVLEANFSIRGRKDNFSKFLEAIEKSPRFMGIETFSYSVETTNDIDIINMSVPLYTFAQSSEN